MSCGSNRSSVVASCRLPLAGELQVANPQSAIRNQQFAFRTPHSALRNSSAFSLLELLVAIAVSMVFIGAVTSTFLQISKGHAYAEARMDALRNGRSALAMMGEEIKITVNKQNSDTYNFVGTSSTLNTGDGIDNDADGMIDEEEVNGVLDVPSPTPPVADLHAVLGTRQERPEWTSEPDMGDTQVDVDARFGRDLLTIVVTPKNATLGVDKKQITYVVTSFDGEDNVLVRQVEIFHTGQPTPEVTVAPLAFKVAGLDFMYWDSNGDRRMPAVKNTWLTTWNSADYNPPDLKLPASVYIRLTMIADPRPAAALTLGSPMEVIPLETIVNVETVIGSGLYKRWAP